MLCVKRIKAINLYKLYFQSLDCIMNSGDCLPAKLLYLDIKQPTIYLPLDNEFKVISIDSMMPHISLTHSMNIIRSHTVGTIEIDIHIIAKLKLCLRNFLSHNSGHENTQKNSLGTAKRMICSSEHKYVRLKSLKLGIQN